MESRIITIISNIRATGWVTILVFACTTYYALNNGILSIMIMNFTSQLNEDTQKDPSVVEMNQLSEYFFIGFFAVLILSVIGLYIGYGLLKIKKWAVMGFHVISVIIVLTALSGLAYWIYATHQLMQNMDLMIPIRNFSIISIGVFVLLCCWLVTRTNPMLLKKGISIGTTLIAMVNIQNLAEVVYDEPQRVKKYFFIYITSGLLEIQVDDKLLQVNPMQVLTITSGQYHFIKPHQQVEGFLLDFTLDYMAKNEQDIELIFQNSLFCHFDYNEIITINHPDHILQQLKLITKELAEMPFQYLTSVHARIELLLVEVNRAKIENGEEVWKPTALFLTFLEFVRNNFEHNYSLSEIAAQLQTTELKLNEQAKLHAGKTAQNVIYGLVISEAKRIIQYENLLMKEVAFRLGFEDPLYFSKFFKNHTGVSPKEYAAALESSI